MNIHYILTSIRNIQILTTLHLELLRTACLLGFYILATSKAMTGWVQICDSAHSWRLYNVAPLGEANPLVPTLGGPVTVAMTA